MYVTAHHQDYFLKAKMLSERHGWIFSDSIQPINDMPYLELGETGLSLCIHFSGKSHSFKVDFLEKSFLYRLRKASIKKESLAKAMGGKSNLALRILDATAGFGRDTMILAWLGFDVTSLEASPIVFELLSDGLIRAKTQSEYLQALSRIKLHHQDTKLFLNETSEKFDVIYLDPMFPERRKSSAVKLNMQILQHLLDKSNQQTVADEALLQLALCCANKRVVVKRPRFAPALSSEMKPSYELIGSSSRFDIYLMNK